ncbi:MAG TPA: hypothetical protein DDW98_08715 [Gammaproteobacteria bacterium]|jgi:predicted nucleic acid-binding protein|nr:hypothetical protein [Gammaproteobacteria bacterium]
MAGTRPVYYWDTCLFIAWLANEQTRKAGELEAVFDGIAKLKRREVSLMTSVLTVVEITANKIPTGTESMLVEAMQRPNFTRIAVDHRVARLAREIRDHYLSRSQWGGKTVSVPDSIHLATAILYRATEFHTFDGKDSKPLNALGLLQLSGDVAGHSLTICKPPVPVQTSLRAPGFEEP